MKVTANATRRTSHGFFEKDKQYKVTSQAYYDLHDVRIKKGKKPILKKSGRITKEDKPAYKIEQKGSWFTVFQDGKEIDKFQGKEGLKKWL